MKERAIAGTFVGVLFLAVVFATRSTDLIYITLTVAFFLLGAAYVWACGRLQKFMDTLVVGLISLVLLVYLIVAMLWPEKF